MTPSGIALCRFTIAVDRIPKQEDQSADFIRVVTWRRLAEICNQYLKKENLPQSKVAYKSTRMKKTVKSVIVLKSSRMECKCWIGIASQWMLSQHNNHQALIWFNLKEKRMAKQQVKETKVKRKRNVHVH